MIDILYRNYYINIRIGRAKNQNAFMNCLVTYERFLNEFWFWIFKICFTFWLGLVYGVGGTQNSVK